MVALSRSRAHSWRRVVVRNPDLETRQYKSGQRMRPVHKAPILVQRVGNGPLVRLRRCAVPLQLRGILSGNQLTIDGLF